MDYGNRMIYPCKVCRFADMISHPSRIVSCPLVHSIFAARADVFFTRAMDEHRGRLLKQKNTRHDRRRQIVLEKMTQ